VAADLARALISGLMILEAVQSALWIQHLLPSLAVRDRTTIALVCLRAVVSSLQIAGGVFLRTRRMTGPAIAQAALIGSALLIVLEVGLRLTPTDRDPTYRWWMVAAYWIYAVAALGWIRTRAR
jgi:hypothetical protein